MLSGPYALTWTARSHARIGPAPRSPPSPDTTAAESVKASAAYLYFFSANFSASIEGFTSIFS
jgi:hypothetical protein